MPSLNSTIVSSASANVSSGYSIYFTDTSNNSVDLNLPQIMADGLHFYFRNIDTNLTSNQTNINAFSGDTIEGQSSYMLSTGEAIHFVAFGTNWYIIG